MNLIGKRFHYRGKDTYGGKDYWNVPGRRSAGFKISLSDLRLPPEGWWVDCNSLSGLLVE